MNEVFWIQFPEVKMQVTLKIFVGFVVNRNILENFEALFSFVYNFSHNNEELF